MPPALNQGDQANSYPGPKALDVAAKNSVATQRIRWLNPARKSGKPEWALSKKDAKRKLQNTSAASG